MPRLSFHSEPGSNTPALILALIHIGAWMPRKGTGINPRAFSLRLGLA
jgi:hypothetical protein